MNEKELSEKESLELITQMIGKAKNTFYDSGFSALLWGFTNFICFALSYLDWGLGLIRFPFSPFWLMAAVFIFHVVYAGRQKRVKTVRTYDDDIHNYTATAFGVAISITTLAGGMAHLGEWVLPFLLVLFGIPTYITGRMTRFAPFIAGAVICWLLAIAAFFLSQRYWQYNLLLLAFAAITNWIVPGAILRSQFLKQQQADV